ncbi:MAG: acyltransferase [Candidatus Eisenbacteria bacterium]|jgi:acetyltransferase-like isoleucine patch superfamily enzyme|nr:acyltransferase [Candidatus Eisenbacteria bacterium]
MDQEIATEFQEQITSGRRSALSVYRDVVYGRPSLAGLVLFEMLTGILGPMPGALGLAMRRVAYRRLLGSLGRGSTIGRDVVIRHPHKIHIGSNVVIDDGVVLDAKGGPETGITLGDGVVLSRGTILSCKGSTITVHDKANFAIGCLVHAGGPVTIGRYALLAAHCYLIGVGNHGMDRLDIPMMAQPVASKGLTLEDDVWLGAQVVVLDGITIGTGSVVGACSMVAKDLPPYSVAVGAPARIVRTRR